MERIDRLEKLLEELIISQKETDAKFKETDAKFKETDAKLEKLFSETNAMFKVTDAKLKEVGRQLGEIGHSSGDAAEEFFYNALDTHKYIGNIKFDEISKNIKAKKHRLEDEYDIFLENGNSVAVIEVKHKVKKDHITKLLDKKVKNFRILFPDYKNYKLFIAIAGLAFEHKTEEYATENGIVVLKQNGNILEVNSKLMKAF